MTVALVAIAMLAVPLLDQHKAYATDNGSWDVAAVESGTNNPVEGVELGAVLFDRGPNVAWEQTGSTGGDGVFTFTGSPSDEDGFLEVTEIPDGYLSCEPTSVRLGGDSGNEYWKSGFSLVIECEPEESQDKEIEAKALLEHSCDLNEWHFVITNIKGGIDAPESIYVEWENSDTQHVSLDGVTGNTAHYYSYDNLDSKIQSAAATIGEDWSGQFNVSHGPDTCEEPDNPPTIDIVGDDPLVMCAGDTYTEPGFLAEDEEDGNLTSVVVVGGDTVNEQTPPGTYTITYEVTDSDYNTVSVDRTVKVKDCSPEPDNPPTIDLIGADNNQLCVNLTYEDKGATASDPEDGDLDHAIVVKGSVDTSTPGKYILEYEVTDSDGNTASVSRTVDVRICGGGGDDSDGSITVCKMIHNGGEFVDGSENDGTFVIDGYDFDFPDSRNLESTTFTTPLDLNTDLFGDDGIDDAECRVYDDLKLGSYGYDQETITGDNWLTPLYTDEYSVGFAYPDSVYEYDPALISANEHDDAGRNKNADGDIRLTEDRSDRTLVVVNRYEKEEAFVYLQPYKYECPTELLLPDWGDGGPDITQTLLQQWASGNTLCERVEWEFEWAPQGVANPGDNIIGNAGGDWTSFTNLTAIPYDDVKDLENLWVREVFQNGYVPFTGSNKTQDISAELYAHTDVLKYDNYDRVDGPFEPGETYLVVGFNALVEEPEENIPPETEIVGDTSFCVDGALTLVASSTDPDGEIVSHLWDWGDGATSTGATSSHMYAATGTYPVLLTVTDDDGATATATTTVKARTCSLPPEDPEIEIVGATTVGVCESLALTASSSIEVTSYEWNLGDGSTATGKTVNHQYDSTGDYTVELTGLYGDGLSMTTRVVVTVEDCDDPGGGGGGSSGGGSSSSGGGGSIIYPQPTEEPEEPEEDPAPACTEADRPNQPVWIWNAGVIGDNIVHLKHLYDENADQYILFEYHNDTPGELVRTHILDVEEGKYRVLDLDHSDPTQRFVTRDVSVNYGPHGWSNSWLNVAGLTAPYTDFHIFAFNAECRLLSDRFIIYDEN